jgi:uncharacterized protein
MMMRQIARVAGDPAAPAFHRFRSPFGEHILVVPYSRIFDLSPGGAAAFDDGMSGDHPGALNALIGSLGEPGQGESPLDVVVAPAPQSISLNVSSSCNLSCSYCYAARGSFDGAQPDPMVWDTAQTAIDALLARANRAYPITIGFLGGEPFANRALIHRSIGYAADKGAARGLDVRFSVTTNGTLLRADDIALLRSHRIAVTISIDGGTHIQDHQRPGGGSRTRGSFAALARATAPLLANPGHAQIAARATVARHNFDLEQRFNDILALGFAEVGFSPLRMDKGGGDALGDGDWLPYLNALTHVANGELARLRHGLPIRLSNLAIALKQLARGASSPYPCGAGGGYFSVASDGRWYACHRAIGSSEFEMGDSAGLNEIRRGAFLEERHVHAQAACQRCWARYLCSGSCHQEATARSDSSCGFVRGWLDFCLSAYCELSTRSQEAPSTLCKETAT